MVLFSVFTCGAENAASEGAADAVESASNHFVTVTPAGTFIHTRAGTFLLQNIQLPAAVVNTLFQAGTSIASRRVIQTLLTYAMACSGQYLSPGWQQWLLQKYEDGSLTSTMQVWHWLLLSWKTLKVTSALFSELKVRWQNLTGKRRYGVMPLYPGGVLDKAVFIDVNLLRSGSYITVSPLNRVELSGISDPWQKTLAQLVNRAIDLDVDQIELKLAPDKSVHFFWHLRDGGWNSDELFTTGISFPSPEGDGKDISRSWLFEPEVRLLMDYLPDSYRDAASDPVLASVLETDVLGCLSEKLLDSEASCPPPSGIQIQHLQHHRKDESCFALHSAGCAALCLGENETWSPGLPGCLTYSTSQKSSSQYRVPLWLSKIMETLLFQLAVKLIEKPVNGGMEHLYRWWHGADSYSATETIRADGWGPERDQNNSAQPVRRWSRVERVKDQSGKSWIKKSAGWYDQGEKGKWHDAFPILAREAHKLSHLKHANIVSVKDSWIESAGTGSARLVVLQDDAGLSLDKVRVTSIDQVRHILRSVVQGLGYIHQQGYAHFDITPNNIMINRAGQVRIGDFGVAGDLNPLGEAIFTGGRNGYIAPGLEVGKPASWKADIWSLGSLAQYLLNRLPVQERAAQRCSGIEDFMRVTGDDWLSNSSCEELLLHPFLQFSGS